MTTASREGRTIRQILFARKREVDVWPTLRGGQEITLPARRNPKTVGYLSAMLCKACVVALRGDVVEIREVISIEGGGNVAVLSRSQSSSFVHRCLYLGEDAYLTRGKVTYHLGLTFLAQALAWPIEANDLLDALEELLEYRIETPPPDKRYDQLLMHLADELYYWARYRDGDPTETTDYLEGLVIRDASEAPTLVPVLREVDARGFTDLEALRKLRREAQETVIPSSTSLTATGSRFKGPQLGELVESLKLGMNCLLVGPTATGKSLCAMEAFELIADGRSLFIIEGHESLREFDLLGGYSPDRGRGFSWSDGVLVQAMREGGFLFLDEANRMPTRTLNVLLGVLSRGAVVLTEHSSEEVLAEEDFQVVMAVNLGQGYAVNAFDRALLDRFPCVLEFRYLAPKEEEALLIAETGLDPKTAQVMVKVANETRSLRKTRELSGELTPRGLFAWTRKYQVKSGTVLDRLQDAASTTWLHAVAGVDSDGYMREDAASRLLSLIEAHLPS